MIETSPEQTALAPVDIPDASLIPATFQPGWVFRRTLSESIGGVLAWGGGYSVLIIIVVILYPILEEGNTLLGVITGLGLLDMVAENYPVDVNALASFPGYLAFEALGWGPTVFSVYLVPKAISVIMGEEERGTIDLLMSTPLPRWQMLTEKALAVVTSYILILLIMLTTLLVTVALVPDVDLTFSQAAAGIFHIFPISLVIFSITLLLSVILRSPARVGGLAAVFIIGSFFVRSVADSVASPLFDFLRPFSIYGYYSSAGAILDGIRWNVDLPVMGFSILVFVVTLWRFQRRDLGI